MPQLSLEPLENTDSIRDRICIFQLEAAIIILAAYPQLMSILSRLLRKLRESRIRQ